MSATRQHAPARPVPAPTVALRVSWVLAAAAVVVQMAFPFTDGGTLALTAASVVLLSASAFVHAGATRGPRAVVVLGVVAGGGGLVVEAVGVRTGVPFGDYAYSGTLGWEVLGVPALVPLAWTMMAWPALLVARRLVGGRGRVATALVGAWALTAWDVFLDPQMVDLGHWAWAHPTPSLPGVEGIPLTNFAGWLVVSLLMIGLLDGLVGQATRFRGSSQDSSHLNHRWLRCEGPRARASKPLAPDRRARLGATDARDGVAWAVYLWTYGSSVLAHAVFFGRPPVSLAGGLVMGLVAVPLAVALLRARRRS